MLAQCRSRWIVANGNMHGPVWGYTEAGASPDCIAVFGASVQDLLAGEDAAGMCETGTAGEKRRLADLGRMAAQDFLAGDTAEQLCAELRAYRRLQHVADMLHKQPQVALLAQWQQLGEFVKEMRAQDAQLLHTRLLTK